MKWEELSREPCSVARTLAVIGDRWTLMILRDCFLGVRRFEAFQARLGISRSIVAERLNLLAAEGVLERRPYQERPVRHEYRLTAKGLDLHPVIMALVEWGDRHYAGEEGPPILRRHKGCGCDFHAVQVCSECGEPVAARDVEARPGPGAVARAAPLNR
ncbi:helix-turn-helix domain-containing protein [Phenylobacterium sp.]|uniref:winged helix-turn-helix transcriptional regulator n=1 Tax=Phenylobacterium sp. TaxID=1871053 RepID=UPI0008C4AB2A|nr:helix-turn-helix domain-containing protein [Phenylobacterium sp.]MBA4794178.1 helix-turn-helix transcriptional regulator [Phenylobacterium sp.]MBC7167352.1 helix-turn-helix transcriptional regulator [Phenylobacterium sp.]OHB40294.1 MAG: HxlR family transcriptional regulator [Phenylobacterium sp. RIFCSPHIGHO2_01_FULL_70_10]